MNVTVKKKKVFYLVDRFSYCKRQCLGSYEKRLKFNFHTAT